MRGSRKGLSGIIARLTFLHILGVVVRMQEAEDEGEAVPLENLHLYIHIFIRCILYVYKVHIVCV